jgi:hypothetical protein
MSGVKFVIKINRHRVDVQKPAWHVEIGVGVARRKLERRIGRMSARAEIRSWWPL